MKRKLMILKNITGWVLTIILVITAIFTATSVFNLPAGVRLFTVQSGSMEPAIKTGSIILTRQFDSYINGDVITYKINTTADENNPKLTVTHRVVETEPIDKGVVYKTKGDANNAPDNLEITKELVLGKVIFALPYIGYPVGFAKTQTGFIIIIVVPATILIYSELLTIKEEVKKLIMKRRNLNVASIDERESE